MNRRHIFEMRKGIVRNGGRKKVFGNLFIDHGSQSIVHQEGSPFMVGVIIAGHPFVILKLQS